MMNEEARLDPGQLNEYLEHEDGEVVFRHACKLRPEGIVSKRMGSPHRSGRSPDWLKMKNLEAVKREAEEDWGGERWRWAALRRVAKPPASRPAIARN